MPGRSRKLAGLNVVADHRIDLRVPAAAVENAVVAHAGLQMMEVFI